MASIDFKKTNFYFKRKPDMIHVMKKINTFDWTISKITTKSNYFLRHMTNPLFRKNLHFYCYCLTIFILVLYLFLSTF